MKTAFSFAGAHYISPTKREARNFLRFYGAPLALYRFQTRWRLKHIEKVPSYCETIRIGNKVEFGMI